MFMKTKYLTPQYPLAYPSCKYLRMYAYDYTCLHPLPCFPGHRI